MGCCSADAGVMFLCVMLGCGTLLLWNTVLTGLDYLGLLFSQCRLDYLPIANFAGNFCFLVIQLRWKGNFRAKAFAGFLIYVAVIGYCLFLVESVRDTSDPIWLKSQPAYFSILVAGMAMAGAGCASLQGSLFGMAGQLEGGGNLCAGLMTGAALAGVICCVSSMCAKLVLETQALSAAEALRQSTAAFFSLSLAITLLSLLLLFPWLRFFRKAPRPALALPTPLGDDYKWRDITNGVTNGATANGDALDSRLLGDVAAAKGIEGEWHGEEEEEEEEDEGRGGWRMGMLMVGVLCMTVTLGLFPGLTAERASWRISDSDHWQPVIQVTVFNVGDLVGRAAAGRTPPMAVVKLWILALLRLSLAPLAVLMARDVSLFVVWHDWINRIGVLVLAVSGGFLASALLSHPRGRGAETSILLALTAGLGLGSLVAVPLAALASP